MSRIGKKPIQIPQGVEVKIDDGKITVKGPKGELSLDVRPEINVEVQDKMIEVSPKSLKLFKDTTKSSAFWGLTRALVANMITGVTEGYEKKLEMVGIGYRAAMDGNDLVLYVGYTHPVKIRAPEGVKFSVDKNIITVAGCSKEIVGQVAAKIRKVKPPEPYKGKGIRYAGEVIRKKLGKKAAAATAA